MYTYCDTYYFKACKKKWISHYFDASDNAVVWSHINTATKVALIFCTYKTLYLDLEIKTNRDWDVAEVKRVLYQFTNKRPRLNYCVNFQNPSYVARIRSSV